MRSREPVDESITEVQQGQGADDPAQPRFAPRVVLGTMIGVFSCLLLAALLMLMFRLPFLAGGGLAGADGSAGAGNGSGRRAGDGRSAQPDDKGDDVATVFDQESAAGTSKGSASGEDSGHQANPTAATSNASSQNLSATADTADADRPRRQRYTIPSIESLQSMEPGEQGQAQAQAPGMFEGRGAEERARLAESEGGSAASEKAVEDGLKWMAKHQDDTGAWRLEAFSQAGDCNGQCGHPGSAASDTGGTGFGLLPFLGAGYTHQTGKHRTTVKKGLDWLIADQTKEGTFRNCRDGTMYAHGVASIALCEAYAMTKDPRLKGPAQRAIDFIVKAQHDGGGWRYRPGEPGDTSVTGWQVIALRSAQQGGLKIPRSVFTKVSEYLDSVQTDKKGSGYRYMPGARITDAMVAEGLLCRIYSSEKLRRGELHAGVEYLSQHPPRVGEELYYWYYATQVLHHYGGEPWDEWNHVIRDLLIETQETQGHARGSWAPHGGHDHSGGRVYATSLSLLTLEVYYRHKRAFE